MSKRLIIHKSLLLLAGIVIAFFLWTCDDAALYNPSETLTNMPVMDLIIDEDEYFNLLTSKTINTRVPLKIIYRGNISEGTIRSSGGGSRLHPRWSYRVELRTGQEVEGLSTFSLSNQSLDRSMLRTTVVSYLYKRLGIPIFANQHVFVRINNRDQGLYLLIERIDETFLDLRNIPVFELFKAEFDADLSFEGNEHPRFAFQKELPEDNNYYHLFSVIDQIDRCGAAELRNCLGPFIDIDNYLVYHAVSSMTNNGDAFRNNYYMYRRTAASPYRFLPWDFDRAFDSDKNLGIAGENALFSKLSQNADIYSDYETQLRFILENHFRTDIIFPIIDSTATYVRPAYNIDPFLGAGGYNLDTQVRYLKENIQNRIDFFSNQLN